MVVGCELLIELCQFCVERDRREIRARLGVGYSHAGRIFCRRRAFLMKYILSALKRSGKFNENLKIQFHHENFNFSKSQTFAFNTFMVDVNLRCRQLIALFKIFIFAHESIFYQNELIKSFNLLTNSV